jgi:hypothetical protein
VPVITPAAAAGKVLGREANNQIWKRDKGCSDLFIIAPDNEY